MAGAEPGHRQSPRPRRRARRQQALQHQRAELMAARAALARMHAESERLFARLCESLEGNVLGGRYRLDRRLTGGGLGVVYEGTDLEVDGPVAVKVLRPSAHTEASELLDRLQRQSASSLAVDHPNVVELYAVDMDGSDLPFVVMELLTGEPLCRRVRRRAPSLGDALAWAHQTALALSAAHEQQVVHGDLSPGNLFLHRAGPEREVLKVVDFGLFDLHAPAARFSPRTRNDRAPATRYWAPERWRGASGTGASDVFGLGVLTYELVAGRSPFGAWAAPALGQGPLHQDPPALRSSSPALPSELDDLVRVMLHPDPNGRPMAAAVARRLRAVRASAAPELLARRTVLCPELRSDCGDPGGPIEVPAH